LRPSRESPGHAMVGLRRAMVGPRRLLWLRVVRLK
jgi:hypothetical protein